ncbi:hypothetical protein CO701_13740 [Citrobacter werkmanii]|nr:hypothetical protein CO701_13740 [Citrobacter werkmanii]
MPTCFRKAGRTRRDAGSGRVLQGRYLAPGPIAWRNKRREPRSGNFPAGSRDCKGRGGKRPLHVHRNRCPRKTMNMR